MTMGQYTDVSVVRPRMEPLNMVWRGPNIWKNKKNLGGQVNKGINLQKDRRVFQNFEGALASPSMGEASPSLYKQQRINSFGGVCENVTELKNKNKKSQSTCSEALYFLSSFHRSWEATMIRFLFSGCSDNESYLGWFVYEQERLVMKPTKPVTQPASLIHHPHLILLMHA